VIAIDQFGKGSLLPLARSHQQVCIVRLGVVFRGG
jgi:hypothetical protein